MQDGATPHTAKETIKFLRSNFGHRVLSRYFNYFWPERSLDLTPCDFWLWGDLKRKKIDELRQCINQEVQKKNVGKTFSANKTPIVIVYC